METRVYPGGEPLGSPPSPLKYRLIYICDQRNSGNRTCEDALTFFWSSLDFGDELYVGRREDLFFSLVFTDIFSGNRKLRPPPPPFKFLGMAVGKSVRLWSSRLGFDFEWGQTNDIARQVQYVTCIVVPIC